MMINSRSPVSISKESTTIMFFQLIWIIRIVLSITKNSFLFFGRGRGQGTAGWASLWQRRHFFQNFASYLDRPDGMCCYFFFANDSEHLDWPAPCNEGKGQKSGKPSLIFCTKLWVLFAPASIRLWQCIICNQVCSPVVQRAPYYAWKVVLGRPHRPCPAPLVRPCERASPTKTSRSLCNVRGNFTNPDSRLLGKVRRAQVDPTRPSDPVFPEK